MALSAAQQAERRARLLTEGMRLVLRDGFAETTIDAIAAAAGIGRRTYFRYFDTKHDLVLAWMSSFCDQIRERARKHAGEGPMGALKAALAVITAPLDEDPDRMRSLLLTIAADPILSAQREMKAVQWRAAIALGLESAFRAGDVRRRSRLLARLGLAIYDDALDEWVSSRGAETVASLIAERLEALGTILEVRGKRRSSQ